MQYFTSQQLELICFIPKFLNIITEKLNMSFGILLDKKDFAVLYHHILEICLWLLFVMILQVEFLFKFF